jgi:hypothetical protein
MSSAAVTKSASKPLLDRPIRDRHGEMRFVTSRFPTDNQAAPVVHKVGASAEPKTESRTVD